MTDSERQEVHRHLNGIRGHVAALEAVLKKSEQLEHEAIGTPLEVLEKQREGSDLISDESMDRLKKSKTGKELLQQMKEIIDR